MCQAVATLLGLALLIAACHGAPVVRELGCGLRTGLGALTAMPSCVWPLPSAAGAPLLARYCLCRP